MDSLMNRKIKTTAFMWNRNMYVPFDQLNASLLNKSINFLKKNRLTQLFKHTYLFPVIPASVIHPLAQQFNGRLSSICFQHGHVQIINEENKIFSQRRPKHTFTSASKICVNTKNQVICTEEKCISNRLMRGRDSGRTFCQVCCRYSLESGCRRCERRTLGSEWCIQQACSWEACLIWSGSFLCQLAQCTKPDKSKEETSLAAQPYDISWLHVDWESKLPTGFLFESSMSIRKDMRTVSTVGTMMSE